MSKTPRALAREQTMRDIVRIGRDQLATVAPADLSLRAVARELGVVSSAVYRYVSSRDELLTLLIVDAYDELADTVDAAVANARKPRTRVHALATALRDWALKEPSRFALLFGTPVPGYAAPADQTVDPGTRVVLRLAGIVEEAWAAGDITESGARLPRVVRSDLDAIRQEFGFASPAPVVAATFGAWSAIVGLVSFDVFDQYGADTFTDRGSFFDVQVAAVADGLGLP